MIGESLGKYRIYSLERWSETIKDQGLRGSKAYFFFFRTAGPSFFFTLLLNSH